MNMLGSAGSRIMVSFFLYEYDDLRYTHIHTRAFPSRRSSDRGADEVSGDQRVGIVGIAVTPSSFVTPGSLRLSSRPSDRREREPGSMGGPGACSLSSAPCSGPRHSTTRTAMPSPPRHDNCGAQSPQNALVNW